MLKKKQTMYHVYLGQDYDDNTIEQEIEKSGLQATYHEEIEPVLAHLLAEGAVVARFNGRMEYGPRALGTARYCIGLMTHPFNIG